MSILEEHTFVVLEKNYWNISQIRIIGYQAQPVVEFPTLEPVMNKCDEGPRSKRWALWRGNKFNK